MHETHRHIVGFVVGLLVTAASPGWAQAAVTQAPATQPAPTRSARPAPAAAQPAPVQVAPPIAVDERTGPDAEAVRQSLHELLNRVPPSVRDVLQLDPSLATSAEYLAPYPELAGFLSRHPEIARNPEFYFGRPRDESWDRDPRRMAVSMWQDVMQGVFVLTIFLIVAGVLSWLIRTLIDYRRWLRLTRVQTETHTKLLDRITSNDDLLAYMQTPAGRRFLESAPIALDAASRPLGAPLSRILWSVQAGVVLALGGIGLLVISQRTVQDVAEPLMAVGILALALGAGFVVSAAIAWFLSARLGLFERRPATDAAGEPGVTR